MAIPSLLLQDFSRLRFLQPNRLSLSSERQGAYIMQRKIKETLQMRKLAKENNR